MIKNNILIETARPLVFIESNQNLEKIISIFISKDISYLPIIQGGKNNKGVIKRKTIFEIICKSQKVISSINIDEIIEKPLKSVNVGESLEDTLNNLFLYSALLVRNKNGSYEKIISTKSVSESLLEYSIKFMKIAHAEKQIKNVLFSHLGEDKILDEYLKIRSWDDTNNSNKSLDLLTLGDYCILIDHLWEKLKILKNYDKKYVMKILNDVRKFRNDVVHLRKTINLQRNLELCEEVNRMFNNLNTNE